MPTSMHGVRPPSLWAMRRKVYIRDGFACQKCGFQCPVDPDYTGRYAIWWQPTRFAYDGTPYPGPYYLLELDHIVPRHHGGRFTLDNLQALCTPCNARKGARLQ